VLHDLSGNGNNGTVEGATWVSSGKFGGALTFNGVNAMVKVKDSASLHLSKAMTLEAWVYPVNNMDDPVQQAGRFRLYQDRNHPGRRQKTAAVYLDSSGRHL
jgi:hypothetical protein